MVIGSAASSSLAGIQNGLQNMDMAATQIASPRNDDKTEPLLEMQQAARDTEANVRALETANEVQGTLLDVKV